MNIAEHKLQIFRQIDQLPEESLIELEKIIAQLHVTSIAKNTDLKALLASWSPLDEDFPDIEDCPPIDEDIF
jgi:hypothetical protein